VKKRERYSRFEELQAQKYGAGRDMASLGSRKKSGSVR
jgi:hypothetical protein